MLDIGDFRSQTCGGVTRRSFLKLGATIPPALGFSGLANRLQASPQARAKSVILVWLWGAPSHLDLCDPKPDAPIEYRGPFAPIATRTPGVHFSELLPRLSQQSDRFSLIRSMAHSSAAHPGAGTVALTGFEEAPEVHANFGAIVAKHRGHRNELPPFFYVGRGIPRDLPRRIKGYGGGRLGATFDPFLVDCQDTGHVEIPALKLLQDLNTNRVADRKLLLSQLDDTVRLLDSAGIANWQRTYQTAYGLLTKPDARAAFDVTSEPDKLRCRYGQTTFGQGCLLARRLVEAGVPYIQVNWSEYVEAMSPGCDFGWDTHIYNFELLQDRHCPILDRALSALLDDLEQRGLLDSTLVVAMGEFGRTPKINRRAARDHWPQCYFSIWAGAGIQPGRVIGASDKLAQVPVTPPISPLMVGTTIAELAGIDLQTRSQMNVLENGQVIRELL